MNNETLANLRQWWQSLKPFPKIMFILGCTGILVTIAVLGQLFLRPNYAPLFTDLEPRNAAKIIEQLESTQTPYRLTNNGKTVEVPEDLVYKLRIQMASSGALIDNGAGFELFDEKKFGITEFEQHVGYQRALQEELRRTIVQLEEVEQARVHLVLPRESVFLDQEVVPSASIALKLKPFAKLEPRQVQGIQSLVVGSIEGLAPENIHIIDMQGNVLNDSLASNSGEMLSASALERYEIKKKFENEMESRVHQMLNPVLGPGRAVAMVSADMDFDREETVRMEHGPGAVLNEQTVTESGSGGSAGGIPGMDSEMPGDTMPFMDGSSESSYSREQRSTNYQVDTTQQTIIKAPGNIRRLSVSVIVDGEYNQAKLDSIQQVVAAAVGYNADRGDELIVSSMAFNDAAIPNFEEQTPVAVPKSSLADLLANRNYVIAASAAGALLLLALVVILMRRWVRKRKEELLRRQAELEAARKAAEKKAQEKEIIFEDSIQPGYKTQIRGLAKEKPSEIAEILKIWLKE